MTGPASKSDQPASGAISDLGQRLLRAAERQWAARDILREAAATLVALEQERDALILERDSAREQFDKHVEWASARCARLEAALRKMMERFDGLAVTFYAKNGAGDTQGAFFDACVAELRKTLAPEGTTEARQ